MARVSLAVYLMFAVAAGPWLCCCSGARLLGQHSAAKHAQSTSGRCCNPGASGVGHRLPGAKQDPETPPHDPCPCRDGAHDPVSISVAKSQFNADSARSIAFSQEFTPGVFGAAVLLTCHLPAMKVGFAFASLPNPRDILSVLQTLRC